MRRARLEDWFRRRAVSKGHLVYALRAAELCSNDPVCAEHVPGESMEERWLHGAACHGCTLIAETSCEMRNEYLDRALVVPTLDAADAAFFPGTLIVDAASSTPATPEAAT